MKSLACQSFRSAIGRRGFLGGIGGLSLPALLPMRIFSQDSPRPSTETAIIQYWLNGAASHFETYDPKPDAPAEVRGPFHPISTNVPGV
ncbi:MAG: hypothetical protein ACKVT0_23290 [Planctomycetaceae bacterium]